MKLKAFLEQMDFIKEIIDDDIEIVINDSRDGETHIYPATIQFSKDKNGKIYAYTVGE